MFVTIDQFREEFIEHMIQTQRLFQALTDESLDLRITEDHRSLGELAWHVISSFQFATMLGLPMPALEPNEEQVNSADHISLEYQKITNALLESVTNNWKDKTLKKTVVLFGQKWTFGVALRFVLNHTIHHCGQMTVLMRQAGLSIPGMYGPTREDWIAQGKEPLM
ncbi:DinB family protein [Shimazuella kribbensis]|uniref:DinB family protein n=1 Tax=Shimazuella kribbensis TaxID=139808 RepID=UPI000407DB12|nr:DinB family protein [Shimazuella kribbensis]